MLFEDQEEFVRVKGAGHGERALLSTEQGVAFLDAMAALAPDSIPNGWEGGIDGCFFTCSVQNERGTVHRFSAWSPAPDSSPQQYAFISLVHQLAWDAAQKAATISLLEKLWGYFNDGLPARVLQEVKWTPFFGPPRYLDFRPTPP